MLIKVLWMKNFIEQHFLSSGSITTADGSALVKLGNTTVICGVKAVWLVLILTWLIAEFVYSSVECISCRVTIICQSDTITLFYELLSGIKDIIISLSCTFWECVFLWCVLCMAKDMHKNTELLLSRNNSNWRVSGDWSVSGLVISWLDCEVPCCLSFTGGLPWTLR